MFLLTYNLFADEEINEKNVGKIKSTQIYLPVGYVVYYFNSTLYIIIAMGIFLLLFCTRFVFVSLFQMRT